MVASSWTASYTLYARRLGHWARLKRWESLTQQHSVTPQKTRTFDSIYFTFLDFPTTENEICIVSKCREPNFRWHTSYPRRTDIHTAVKTEKLTRCNFSTNIKGHSTASNTSQNYSCRHNIQVLTTSGCDMTQLFASCRCMVINSYHRQPDLYIKLLTVTRQGNSGGCNRCMRYVVYWIAQTLDVERTEWKWEVQRCFFLVEVFLIFAKGWYFKLYTGVLRIIG